MSNQPDALLAQVAEAIGPIVSRRHPWMIDDIVANECARAVLAVVVEACAKVCDERIGKLMNESSERDEIEWRAAQHRAMGKGCRMCAADIRAITTPEKEPTP